MHKCRSEHIVLSYISDLYGQRIVMDAPRARALPVIFLPPVAAVY